MKNLIFILFFCSFSLFSFSQESKGIRLKHFNLKKDVAISGYDPVSYFVNKPTKGSTKITYNYNGVMYYFISEKSKKIFVSSPEKYEPAYGGWCAYAMGLGKSEKVAINPNTYKIINNKLYLFYNKFGVNTLNKWNEKGENQLKNKADKNWNNIISE